MEKFFVLFQIFRIWLYTE